MRFDPVGLMTDGHASGYNTPLQFCPARVLVVDEEGEPLQVATVAFGSTELATGVDGRTEWTELPAGRYAFEVAKDGYRSVSGQVVLEHRVDWLVILKYVGVLARHFGTRAVGASDARVAGVSSTHSASRSCEVDEAATRGPRRVG